MEKQDLIQRLESLLEEVKENKENFSSFSYEIGLTNGTLTGKRWYDTTYLKENKFKDDKTQKDRQ